VSVQIIVVDDGSKDNTAKTAFEFVRKHSLDIVRVIKLGHNQGKGAAVQRVSLDRLKPSGPHLRCCTSVIDCYLVDQHATSTPDLSTSSQTVCSRGNVYLAHGARTFRKVSVDAW
jgi:hypothetical protein